MEIEKHIRQRLELGERTYGKDAWKKLTPNELIQMTQEELVDAINYLNWLKAKGIDLTNLIPLLKSMYNTIEVKRK